MSVKRSLLCGESGARADRHGACAEITAVWCQEAIRCELASIPSEPSRILLWVGGRLVFEHSVSSWDEVTVIAGELERAYASVAE